MLVVIANQLPNAIRGKMKLWFVEPRPSVFISSVSDSLATRVAEMLLEYCGDESGMLVIQSIRQPPGYKIFQNGMTTKNITELTGLQLIIENQKQEG